MTVALDATPLLGQPTGVGVFCRQLLEALGRREDLSVRAFAVSWRQRHLVRDQLPPGVASRQRAMPARPLHQAWRRLGAPPIEWFIGPTDVVHGTNFVVPPARRAARVVTVHDLTTVRYPELCTPDTRRFPALVRRALAEGAWVHTPSVSVADEVVEVLGADPARVRAVHSGVPDLPQPGAARRIALPRGCHRYVLALGTAEPRKDLPGLVRAFGEIGERRSDTALVLAGPPGWGSEELERTVSGSALRGRIVRTGWVDDATVADLLAGAAVLAYPSRYEGFGFPPLQAMAAGVPVVATRAGSLPEVLGDAARLVEVGDGPALAEALAEVLDDHQVVAGLVARGREQVGRYSWERCAAGLADLYRQAAIGDQR